MILPPLSPARRSSLFIVSFLALPSPRAPAYPTHQSVSWGRGAHSAWNQRPATGPPGTHECSEPAEEHSRAAREQEMSGWMILRSTTTSERRRGTKGEREEPSRRGTRAPALPSAGRAAVPRWDVAMSYLVRVPSVLLKFLKTLGKRKGRSVLFVLRKRGETELKSERHGTFSFSLELKGARS